MGECDDKILRAYVASSVVSGIPPNPDGTKTVYFRIFNSTKSCCYSNEDFVKIPPYTPNPPVVSGSGCLPTTLNDFKISISYLHSLSSPPPISTDPLSCAVGTHVCNRAKYNILFNGTDIGGANLNNGGGALDPGPFGTSDRLSEVTIPNGTVPVDGCYNLELQCAVNLGDNTPTPERCHNGIASIYITDTINNIVCFKACVDNDVTICIPTGICCNIT